MKTNTTNKWLSRIGILLSACAYAKFWSYINLNFLGGQEIYGGFFSIPGDLVSLIYIKMFTYLKRGFERYTQTETFPDSDVVAFFYLSEFCYDIIIYHHLEETSGLKT